MNTRWTAILTASLLIGCVSSDGSKALKREDPTEAAAKTNIQLGIAYLQQGNYAVAREKLDGIDKVFGMHLPPTPWSDVTTAVAAARK